MSEPTPPTPKTVQEYIMLNQHDTLLWIADRKLSGIENVIQRNDRFTELAHIIAKIEKPVARDDYAGKIGHKYNLSPGTFKKMIADAIEVRKKQAEIKKTVRKNQVIKLDNPRVYPFFEEIIKKEVFDSIRINKVKFVDLLRSFGFSRYEIGDNDSYTFVRIQDNIIKTVSRDEIIDFVEKFITTEYNFEGAGIEHVNSEMLINKFYDGMRTYFSKDLFARVRSEGPIIINCDKTTIAYLYYKNGFVEITDKGYELKSYEQMDGSIWDHQMIDRDFVRIDHPVEPIAAQIDEDDLQKKNYKSDFVDFCWKVSGMNDKRFFSLMAIIGYLVHDFYDYKLKAVLFTDSTISEFAEGRTGKTLLLKILSKVRSLTEINGKDFNTSDKNKYEDVRLGTQIVHLNDVSHKGKNAFSFEDVFNDITEGMMVNAKYMKPFRQFSKIAISTNKSLNIVGGSQRDRILEFEMSDFFSEKKTPEQFYGRWLVRDWDKDQWQRYDNFICYCAQQFLTHGLIDPPTINLEERKLRDHSTPEFVEYMTEKVEEKEKLNERLMFDKKLLYEDFKKSYSDFNHQKFQQRTFTKWLRNYGTYRFAGAMEESKSNGAYYIEYLKKKTP